MAFMKDGGHGVVISCPDPTLSYSRPSVVHGAVAFDAAKHLSEMSYPAYARMESEQYNSAQQARRGVER